MKRVRALVTDDDVRLAAIADDCGAVYKPSGAGGGDVGLVFTGGQEQLEQSRRAIAGAGYRILNMTWGAPGVTL